MMRQLWEGASAVLGLNAEDLAAWQMALRAGLVYVAALAMVRLGEKRFLGKNTAFDVILAIVLGSVVSRAITGSTDFFPTLGAGVVLVAMHWLFAFVAFRFSRFGTVIKGSPRTLVLDGRLQWDQMRKSHITEDDLMMALRSQGNVDSPEGVKSARLERSGDLSVIKRDRPPRVIEVRVEAGVQFVRIELKD